MCTLIMLIVSGLLIQRIMQLKERIVRKLYSFMIDTILQSWN